MKARTFNGMMFCYNHDWAANVLNMTTNHPGPDLIDDSKLIELKFFLKNPKPHPKVEDYKNKKKWTANDNQLKYPNDWERKGYWGMGFYELSKPIISIRNNTINLEQYILSRELFIIHWDWMYQFKKYHTSGIRKDGSPWDDYLRYPNKDLIPKTEKLYIVDRGIIHITNGVDQKGFTFSHKNP